jgi:predicted dehydrogenase
MKNWFEEGKIGEVSNIQINWKRNWKDSEKLFSWWNDEEAGGGLFYAIGVHYIDIINYITKLKITSVIADFNNLYKTRKNEKGEDVKVTSDDSCSLLFKYENGASGIL